MPVGSCPSYYKSTPSGDHDCDEVGFGHSIADYRSDESLDMQATRHACLRASLAC